MDGGGRVGGGGEVFGGVGAMGGVGGERAGGQLVESCPLKTAQWEHCLAPEAKSSSAISCWEVHLSQR